LGLQSFYDSSTLLYFAWDKMKLLRTSGKS
jgi:hypothetical protein